MVNIYDLSNDEIKYICELMYIPSVRRYLQKNIKEFNRIRPGFTVKKMSDEDILSFLIKYSYKSLVQDLIRVVVQEWLVQIQDNISELVNQGFSSGEALIKTIPDCVFAERIELYFKLSDQPYDDKYLELLSDALSLVKRTSTTALQEHNSEIVSEQIQAANNEIEKLNNQLADREQCEKTMQQALDDANESILQYQAQITEFDERFRRMEAEAATIKSELDRYTMLERYIDDSGNITQFSQFQHTSIGKVIYDYNRAGYLQKYIIRLADISDDGTIKLFTKDRNLPHYFDNRDRLHCNDGPEEENSIGVWNWSATPRDTDPEKDYVKTQYYDIDKHSTIEGEDISKELKKGSIRNYVYCTMPYEICYLQNKKTGNWDIRYGYVYKYKKGILFNTGNGYLNDKRCRFNMNNEKEDIYEISLKDSLESKNMFSFPFYKLLKKNGVDYKYICYAPYCSEYSYDDLEMYIRTEGLPNKSAKLYKIYPKLKQYIGKKDKLVSLFIKGAKNPDELVSYFLPEGKKVNYGKKGIEVDDDSKKRFRSYEEYLQIKKEE